MSVPEVRTLGVWLGPERVGTLVRLPDDRITFAFDPDYERNPARSTLSLGFKARDGALLTPRVTQTRLPPYFANLLPEGPLREYLATRLGTKVVRDFPLIAELGGDLPGNVRVVPEGTGPREPMPSEVSSDIDRPLKFSLAGVQLKFSALEDASGGLTIPMSGAGGDWIVKLPSTTFADVPVHEHAMLHLARETGLEVPAHRLIAVSDLAGLPADVQRAESRALAVRRFDRADGARIHTEDFAQVFRVYPEEKYKGASSESLARVLLAEQGTRAVVELARRLVFTVLIGNGDAHLKNWSLIYRDPVVPVLAPLYDQVGTVVYMPDDQLGLSLGGTKVMAEIGLDHLVRFADRVGVPTRQVIDATQETVAAFKVAWRNLVPMQVELPKGHREALESHFARLALWKVG